MNFNQGSFKKNKSYNFYISETMAITTDGNLTDLYFVTTEENKKQGFTKEEFGLFFNLEKEGA